MNRQGIGLWIVVIALLVLDIGVHCVRAQDNTSKLIKTQDLQILDTSGNEVADLSSDQKTGGAAIALYDPKGNQRLGLYADNTGGGLQFYDATGNTLAYLDGSDPPSLVFYKGQQSKVSLGSNTDGVGMLSLDDDAGNERAEVSYNTKDDAGRVAVWDKTGKSSAILGQDNTGAYVYVCDPAGTDRAGMMVDTHGNPDIYVADKNGKDVWDQSDQASAANSNTDSNNSSSSGSNDSNPLSGLHQPRNRNSN